MKQKALILIIGIFVMRMFGSCCKDYKYYDYSSMSAFTSDTLLSTNDTLELSLSGVELIYIASNVMPDLGFDQALGLSCDFGWGGMKFPFKSIEITSSTDFDSTHLATKSLNDLFQLRTYNGPRVYTDTPILSSGELSADVLVIVSSTRPTLAKEHVFTFKLTKSNDSVVVVESPRFRWE